MRTCTGGGSHRRKSRANAAVSPAGRSIGLCDLASAPPVSRRLCHTVYTGLDCAGRVWLLQCVLAVEQCLSAVHTRVADAFARLCDAFDFYPVDHEPAGCARRSEGLAGVRRDNLRRSAGRRRGRVRMAAAYRLAERAGACAGHSLNSTQKRLSENARKAF